VNFARDSFSDGRTFTKSSQHGKFSGNELLLAPPLESRRLQCYVFLALGDAFAIFSGFGAAGYIAHGAKGFLDALNLGLLICIFFSVLALHNRAYSIETLCDRWIGMLRALQAFVLAVSMVILLVFFAKAQEDISRLTMLGGAALALPTIGILRFLAKGFVRYRCGAHVINELIIDDGGPAVRIGGAIRISAEVLGLRPDLSNPDALDRIGLILRNIDRVVVSCPPGRRSAWSMMLKGANVDGEVIDDVVSELGAQGARVAGGRGLLLVSVGPLGVRDRMVKRAFDLVCAGIAALLLLPLVMIVALAIKLEDGGPVFFVQRRMGRGNRFFNMYKFRSMTQSLCDGNGNVSASKDDQRITRIGRFIRRTSIDELPQIFNVLLGDMSLVGPRPHATGSLAGTKLFWEVDARYWQRHCLKPGLSGLAQVRGFRGATDTETDLLNRLQSDLEYLEGWTIMRDLKIIFLTLRVVVHDRAF